MPTQTGSIDLASQKAAHDAAAQVATNYVTDLTNGVFVHPENDTNNGVKITDKVEILKGNTSVAEYGDTVRIGKTSNSYINLDYRSFSMIDWNTNTYFKVGDLRDENGYASIEHVFIGDGVKRLYQFSPNAIYNIDPNNPTDMVVTVSDSSGGTVTKTVSSVTFSTAPTNGAVITVTYTTGNPVHYYTLGDRYPNSNMGTGSTAIGTMNTSSGICSVAMGALNTAEGSSSVATGWSTSARGANSATFGRGTTAKRDNSVTMGRYNADSNAVFLIGYGTSTTPANVFEVFDDGSTSMAGNLTVSGSITSPTTTITTNDTGITDADFIAKSTNVNVSYAGVSTWGKMVTFAINFSLTNNLTVPASGILSSPVTVGTVVSQYRPGIAHQWSTYGMNAGFASGYIDENGVMSLRYCHGTGSQRTINAGSVFNVRTVMVMA